MTHTTDSTEARKAAIFARATTKALVGAVLILDAKANPTSEERLTYAWTCDELERRAGGVQDDIAFAEFMDANEGMTYAELLLAWFPALTEAV